ncbi:MAG: hypothetical protein Q7T82_02570 [Armatimonadota bacterium]|nr:hypothetical protein [Armatimonadota bacterium]
MPRTGSIQYIVDDKGRKKSVVIGYRAYLKLTEELDDLLAKIERGQETPEDFDSVLTQLRDPGKV